MVNKKFRLHFGEYLGKAEIAVYLISGVLLVVAALEVIGSSSRLLWDDLRQGTVSTGAVYVLDELLLVLMIVEILHTVRLSIRSHVLVTEPFLIVGLIASVRRVLVITLETADLTRNGKWSPDTAGLFHASTIELALLGLLILVLVVCIVLLRRVAPVPTSEITEPERPQSQN